RRAQGGRTARRAVPRRGAAAHGDPRNIRLRAPRGRDRSGRPTRESLSRHRGARARSDGRQRGGQGGAEDRDRGVDDALGIHVLLTARNVLTHSAGLYARALLATSVAVALFFALSYAATFVARNEIAAKLEAANARGAFTQPWATATGRAIPRFGGNDCLFFATLL